MPVDVTRLIQGFDPVGAYNQSRNIRDARIARDQKQAALAGLDPSKPLGAQALELLRAGAVSEAGTLSNIDNVQQNRAIQQDQFGKTFGLQSKRFDTERADLRAERERRFNENAEWRRLLTGEAPSNTSTRIAMAESGGNDAAKNPLSTATGRYQIIDSTWKTLQKNYPGLGLTDDGRTDPIQAEKAQAVLEQEYAATLGNAGIPVNDGTMYAAHFLGAPTAAAVLRAPDNVPLSELVSPDAVKANPFLANMTVGDFKAFTVQKMGGGAQPAQTGATGQPMRLDGQTPATPQSVQGAAAPAQGNIPAQGGGIFEGLTPTQRTIIARAGPEKGLPMLAAALETNAQNAKSEAEKARANSAMHSLLVSQGVAAPLADEMVAAGVAGEMVKAGMKADKLPASVQEFLFARDEGFKGSLLEYETAKRKAGASSVNVGFNEGQSNAATFADRMTNSEKIIRGVEKAGLGRFDAAVSGLPLSDLVTSAEYKQFDQAKRDFINALLRKESGAAIGKAEFDNAEKQYFPQPGDPQEVIEQKRKNREIATAGMIRAAGPNYQTPTSDVGELKNRYKFNLETGELE